MISRLTIYFIVLLQVLLCTPAAGQDKEPLLVINGHNIEADEFLWLYSKNNQGESAVSMDEYLNLFINFKLKVEAAADAGIDQTESFRKELKGYRDQLAKNYLTDQKVKDELIRKAYERSKTEIQAYHVLIACREDASPADTLEAWAKALKIRERIRLGEPIESVARGASDDPNVLMNGGNLGYFSVFQTPAAFENAVYKMKPGEISGPVRTAQGYHIIKVQNRRNASGRIKVAHIMKATPLGVSPKKVLESQRIIDSLYILLTTEKADFGQLAKDNSDDITTAGNGGELPWFIPGEMVFEFSEEAFKLMHDGDISKPFKSPYGWHIIKRIAKEIPDSFEEKKNWLESRLSQSYLATISRMSFISRLKEEYRFTVNSSNLNWFYLRADSIFRSTGFRRALQDVPEGVLYKFADQTCSMSEFAGFIREKGSYAGTSDSITFINDLLKIKSDEDLMAYEDSRLEIKYPEFRYLVKEFHDGIMLFEISDSLLWKRSVTDSIGLQKYYESRKEEFAVPASIEADIYTVSEKINKKKNRELMKLVSNMAEGGEKPASIVGNSVTQKGDTLVKWSYVKASRGENRLTDRIKWQTGLYTLREGKVSYIIKVNSVKNDSYQPLDNIMGRISSEWAKQLESDWILQLREKYSVIINRDLLKKLKEK